MKTKKALSLVLLLALLFPQGGFGQSQPAPELIVRLTSPSTDLVQTLDAGPPSKSRDDSLFAGVAAVQSLFPSSTAKARRGSAESPSIYTLRARDSTVFRLLLRRWRSRPDVAYAHPNYTFRVHSAQRDIPSNPILAPNNPRADSLDHLGVVQAFEGWDFTTGASDVTIGIVDTGFYLEHPDLRDEFWINEPEDINNNGRFDPGDLNGIDDDGNGFVDDVIGYDFVDRPSPLQEGEYETRDPDPSADPKAQGSGHGSSVAAVAGASPQDPEIGIAGVAPGAKLVGLRAFGGDGVGRSDDIAAAIVYAATMGVDVLNLSFGRSRPAPVIHDAVQFAHDQGTIIVGSAGNELTDDPHYPSDYPEVLSVVWLAEDGEGLPQFNRSQYGIGVDIGAPGSGVYTADFPAQAVSQGMDPETTDLYRSINGSSFSAPQVAGAAALLRSADSSLSPASVRSILTATADDLEAESWDHQTGAGLLNVDQGLSRAYPARTEIVHPSHNQGISGTDALPIVGTALNPAFEEYAVYVAKGTSNLDERTDPWMELTGPTSTQVLRDTIATWPLANVEEGEYTLRLVTRLQDGGTIEDRRRIIVDRTPPSLRVELLGDGRINGEHGIVGDLVTDDRTRLTTTIRLFGVEAVVQSEQVARRHGLAWANESGRTGTAEVQIRARNTSGLTTTLDTTLQLPGDQENTALLHRNSTSVPRGRLLSKATDFDGDGLHEIVLNQSTEGGLSDSLRSFEWRGDGFVSADTLIATLFPKDVGDTDGDGLQEILLQVRAGTLLLEQRSETAFPDDLIFADTTSTDEKPLLNGTRLTDFDGDGNGEILATTGRQWTVLEHTNSGFVPRFRLDNPTAQTGRDSALGNAFDTPAAQTGDFDGDGRRDLLVGDRDGDVIVYEATGTEDMTVAWTHETDRVDAGNRFAAGDIMSGGGREFVTMTTYPPFPNENGESAPQLSVYSIWTSTGDNSYERVYTLPVAGPYTDYGSMTTADLDGDDLQEVAIAHAPSLLVLDWKQGQWQVLHEHTRAPPLQSRGLVAADFSGSGRPSLVAETAGDSLARFSVDPASLPVSPPRWTRARPTGANEVVLEWRAPGADSVSIFAGPPNGPLNHIRGTVDSTVRIGGTAERRFALRAWENGTSSPLSSHRRLRPHAAATVTEVGYPSPHAVKLRFTERLASSTRSEQFQFGPASVHPTTLIQSNDQTGVVLRFPARVAGQSGRLQWAHVVDTDGLPVGQTDQKIVFPASEQRSLYVESTEILDQRRVRLSFNEPLSAGAATDRDRYKIRPRGRVASVEFSTEAPTTVTLRVEGLVIGAKGRESSLTVTEMISLNGHRLTKEGGTVRLTTPADDLSNVYVYPNPYRAQQHDGSVTIAGLPTEASIRIFSPDGRLVRRLSVEANRDGGVRWDLRNRRGERVPAGIYLFRVNAPDHSPVLEKAAVIR
ncbi:hypothetical protein BSZ35_01640 [Salinibacter sp. 10B]|uniref:S8 family serine peptidase n=1 Tax=Salinibacter sp. 10B TaxID=1923971 RepID=UPI000D2792FF|nr:S8 family serine peptidase [Salinibacter sp. 10B]PQJ33470.1 hypothetical protein BSZ35_01640 [Salinibacter sp. 10B]